MAFTLEKSFADNYLEKLKHQKEDLTALLVSGSFETFENYQYYVGRYQQTVEFEQEFVHLMKAWFGD